MTRSSLRATAVLVYMEAVRLVRAGRSCVGSAEAPIGVRGVGGARVLQLCRAGTPAARASGGRRLRGGLAAAACAGLLAHACGGQQDPPAAAAARCGPAHGHAVWRYYVSLMMSVH